MLAEDLALALDPPAFAEHALGVRLDDWQHAALCSTHPRELWCITRQGGKSTVAAALAIWTAVYRPSSLVLVVSPSLRQSAETFRKCAELYRAADRPVSASAETTLRLELENRSRVISLPGSEATTRGFSAPHLILLDEAARIDDDLMSSLTPMQATVSDGRLIALTTPAGKRGWFWQAWSSGGESWHRVEVRATDVPRISPTFLELERATMPAAQYRQEYLCSFEESDMAVFAADAVSAAIDPEAAPLELAAFGRWTA